MSRDLMRNTSLKTKFKGEIEIGLSGNVIPHIFNVLQAGNYSDDIKELYPNEEILGSSFKWSKNKVDLICDKDNVSSVIKKMMFFQKIWK